MPIALRPDQYALLDFGRGRKLERFGALVVDRPAPGAQDDWADRAAWSQANGRFDAEGGWQWKLETPADWAVEISLGLNSATFRCELKPTHTGQVGFFPEQAENWQTLFATVARGGRPVKVLNLFAYTGASTLAAVAAGAEVTHVDAARSVVAWARRNAATSKLAEAPIRWIVEDAAAFVRRELRRGSAYDGVLLDPPSYGHGPKGQTWRLADDLPALVADCRRLIERSAAGFVVLSCHTTGVTGGDLAEMLDGGGRATSGPMEIAAVDGRRLDAGVAVWFHA